MTAAVQPPAKNSNSHVNWASGSAMLPTLVDIETLAVRLGISARHVRRLVTERRIPFVKIGNLVRFDPADIARWVDGLRSDVTTEPAGPIWVRGR